MVFEIEGVRYDSVALIAHRTGRPHMPLVYVTMDFKHVFVVTLSKWNGVRVHRADEVEVARLAEELGIDDLTRTVRRSA
jgi:hypothetical protein